MCAKYWILFSILGLPHFAHPFTGFLNLNEIETGQYVVNINDAPVVEELEKADASRIVPMVNKFGQKYDCALPPSSEDDEIDNNNGQHHEKGSEDMMVDALPELLAPMAKERCLFKTKGYWTYEFCYQKYILQYHVEDGEPVGGVKMLGFYDSDFDWNTLKKNGSIGAQLRHHKQFYVNGTECDLNGEMRKTEVRFECEPLIPVDSISRVDEPESCEYVMTVQTSKICSIPHFAAGLSKKHSPIQCTPVLSQAAFDKYSEFKKAEEKTKKLHTDQKLPEAEDMPFFNGIYVIENIVDMINSKLDPVKSRSSMSDKIVKHLATKISDSSRFEDIFLNIKIEAKGEDNDDVEEIVLPSGEKQSRLKKKPWYQLATTDRQSHRDKEETLGALVELLKDVLLVKGKKEKIPDHYSKNIMSVIVDAFTQIDYILQGILDVETNTAALDDLDEVNEVMSEDTNNQPQANSDTVEKNIPTPTLEEQTKEQLEQIKQSMGERRIKVIVIAPDSLQNDDSVMSGYQKNSFEAQRTQQMINSLIEGNHVGYLDLHHQQNLERNYQFHFDERNAQIQKNVEENENE